VLKAKSSLVFSKPEPVKPESVKPEPVKPEPVKPEPVKPTEVVRKTPAQDRREEELPPPIDVDKVRKWGRCYDHNFRRFLPIF
jgi:hypothetical protein